MKFFLRFFVFIFLFFIPSVLPAGGVKSQEKYNQILSDFLFQNDLEEVLQSEYAKDSGWIFITARQKNHPSICKRSSRVRNRLYFASANAIYLSPSFRTKSGYIGATLFELFSFLRDSNLSLSGC